jgi:hypothetical protein
MDIEKLKAAAEKCTALNLDSAEFERGDDNCIDCPICGGEGYVYLEGDYCNIDDVALGVQFYGIGNHHKAAEEYFRIALPANIIALCDELATLRQYKAEAESQKHVAESYKCSSTGTGIDWAFVGDIPEGTTKLYARPVPAGICLAKIKADAVKEFCKEIGLFDPEYDDNGYIEVSRYSLKEHCESMLSAIPSNSEGDWS